MKQAIRYVLLAVLLIVIIAFFPWKFQDGSTCLADRLLFPDSQPGPLGGSADVMIRRYFIPFALCWWISIAAMVLAWKKTIRRTS